MLRVYYAYPDHTVFTHAQLYQVLVLTLALNLLSVLLFLGKSQCSTMQILLAACAAATTSLLGTLSRLLFK